MQMFAQIIEDVINSIEKHNNCPMINIDDYCETRECDYKEEHYSVRDNGSVMRHSREGKRIRKDDNLWTFGKMDERTGYLLIAGERVHRIVAYAFHGEPPTKQHVVDHIDTNRQNNRPENLRWLTRLENVLNNPITRARIENICGSIEAFLKDPSILRGHETIDPNFSWMRQVTKEEALVSLKKLTEWANQPNRQKPSGQGLGDWIFQESNNQGIKSRPIYRPNNSQLIPSEEMMTPTETQSLTPNAIQLDWKHPVEFPCCPTKSLDNSLEQYMANLEKGKVFSRNDYGSSIILNYGMPDPSHLWVMSDISVGFKTHGFTRITYKDGVFYHENMGVYDMGDDPEEVFEGILANKN